MVIPGCETWGRSGTEVHFSHILETFWVFFASVTGGVGSCDGWWILGQSFTTCSTVSSPISAFYTDGVHFAPYFVQLVLELRVVATSQSTHRRLLFPSQL